MNIKLILITGKLCFAPTLEMTIATKAYSADLVLIQEIDFRRCKIRFEVGVVFALNKNFKLLFDIERLHL